MLLERLGTFSMSRFAFVIYFQYVLKVTGVTIVLGPVAVSQPTPERVMESLVPVIVSMVGLAVTVMLISMNVVTLPFTSVWTTQSVRTPMDRSTANVIAATLRQKMPLVKVFVLLLLIFVTLFFHENICWFVHYGG